MIGSTTGHRGVGLAALLQGGVAGWLHAVGTCAIALPSGAASATRPVSPIDREASGLARTSVTPMMPPTHYIEVARLIASLVLSGHPVHGPLRVSQQGDSR
jgi:hypothetical protein